MAPSNSNPPEKEPAAEAAPAQPEQPEPGPDMVATGPAAADPVATAPPSGIPAAAEPAAADMASAPAELPASTPAEPPPAASPVSAEQTTRRQQALDGAWRPIDPARGAAAIALGGEPVAVQAVGRGQH